ncbi:hypothetical protein D3C78_1634240 [compost metagenome]
MGQRRTQCARMRGQGQPALLVDAQAFALDAVQAPAEQGQVGSLAEQGQAAEELVAQVG